MKKVSLLVLYSLIILVLGACSLGNDEKKSVEITQENKPYLEEYNDSLQDFIKEMNKILGGYNKGLDGIYTQEYSNQQFADVLKSQIKESNGLIKEVESLNVKPELFQMHQQIITLINRSHQLLLTSIDAANNPDMQIEKDPLRQEYLAIKQEQAVIANDWKVLMEQLKAQEKAEGEL